MNNFEKKIIDLYQADALGPDTGQFLHNLRQRHLQKRMMRYRIFTGLSAFLFIITIGLITSYQLNESFSQDILFSFNEYPVEYPITIFDDEVADSILIEEFTLFILEENNLWDTEDLLYYDLLYEDLNYIEVTL